MQGSNETRVGIFVLIALLILAYMGFQIGAFRFDSFKYNTYTLYFNDISGLSRKAEVKIAGVKVGWVDNIILLENRRLEAEITIKVLKEYMLYEDAYGVVRQEGFLGSKYLEIVPGDSLLHTLHNKATLGKPSVAPVSVDNLLHQFKDIAQNVQVITESLKDTIGTPQGKEEMRAIMHNLNKTVEYMSSFSQVLDHSFANNEANIQAILEIGTHVRNLSTRLENDILPSFQNAVEKISCVFDRDFASITDRLTATATALEEASIQVRDGFKSANAVIEKIDDGQGCIGKLINDDETYQDIKIAVEGLRTYFNVVDKLQVVFDTHFESMMRPAENYDYEDSKGYFDIKLYPSPDYFFLLQMVGSEKGYVDRYETVPSYIDCDGYYVDTANFDMTPEQKLKLTYTRKNDIYTRGTMRFGLQLGKVFGNMALRMGIFENSVGAGVDVDVAIVPEKLRWVTSLEVFDFRGWNRRDDRRPHVKWLNRMFFMRSLYFSFGADDVISKRNANIFFGAGLRFGDDEVKYLLGALGGGGMGGGGLSQVIAINR